MLEFLKEHREAFAVILAAHLIDLTVTAAHISRPGQEGNPFMVAVLRELGVLPGLVAGKVAALATITVTAWLLIPAVKDGYGKLVADAALVISTIPPLLGALTWLIW